MPDKSLRLFTPGTGGINTFTASATGGSWTHQSGVGWGGAVAESAYVIGATLTKDGQPVRFLMRIVMDDSATQR